MDIIAGIGKLFISLFPVVIALLYLIIHLLSKKKDCKK